MATKPTETVTWATNANYTVGPFTGFPTKLTDPLGAAEGSIPAQGVVAEFYNRVHNILGQWTSWLNSGSFDPLEEAHVVETDADGETGVASALVGDTLSSNIPLTVSSNSGDDSLVSSITNNGVGDGLSILTSSGNTLDLENDSGTNATLNLTQNGSDRAVLMDVPIGLRLDFGASGSGELMVGTTSSNTPTLLITTSSTSIGHEFRLDNAVSQTTSNAILAVNTGLGRGVLAFSQRGRGLVATCASGEKAPLQLTPNLTTPVGTLQGDIWYSETAEKIGYANGPGATDIRHVWATRRGLVDGFNIILGAIAVVANQDDVTCSINEPEPPFEAGGFVEITSNFYARSSAPGPLTITYEIRDVTSGFAVGTRSVIIPASVDVPAQHQTSLRASVPLNGNRQYTIRFLHDGFTDYTVTDRSLRILGIFESLTTP